MNTRKFIIAIAASLLTYLSAAQTATNHLFEKYGNKDGFNALTFNGDLIKLMASNMKNAAINIDSLDLGSIDFSKINSVKLLIYDSKDKNESGNFIRDIEKAIEKDKFIKLIDVFDDGKISISAIKDKSDFIKFAVYHRSESSATAHFIYLDGVISEKTIQTVMKKMNKK
jgi:hypothetical protein